MRSNHIDVILTNHRREACGGGMQAIDLYSGVGGWSLGLRMAGIDVVSSYEWWDQANRTYEINFGQRPVQADLRTLPVDAFPKDVDLVVGSPPCTQFSYANRGGNGDIHDGLKDVLKFLEVVEYVRPRFWVMENVPRVSGILERELSLGGSLERFSEFVKVITVVDMTDFALPQRRKRMLAGDFPLQLLEAYRGRENPPTLGEVVAGLSEEPANDPIYGLVLERHQLTGHLQELPLNPEEVRLNQAMKQQHPFYNVMSFPDSLDRTARTVTALCTRVSRESIIIDDGSDGIRRLTLRERATLQGFPITFQFAARAHSDALKMAGNAIPPLLTYYIGNAILGADPDKVLPPRRSPNQHPLPPTLPEELEPRAPKRRYSDTRRFRAVIPTLRFGSGLRFELANRPLERSTSWEVGFYFGTSKNIQTIQLDRDLLDRVQSTVGRRAFRDHVTPAFEQLKASLDGVSGQDIQSAWIRRSSRLHPFALVDQLGHVADQVHSSLYPLGSELAQQFVLHELSRLDAVTTSRQWDKLRRNASRILAGFIVGAWFNSSSGLRMIDQSLAEAV
jgi:DNA (cytosine-5)-methyltransferase 1